MSDFLRNNWFVVVVALVICGFLAYFIYDANKDNVSGKTADGKDVVASLTDVDITAEDLFDKGSAVDGQLLYNLYKNAVVSQSVETKKAMEEEAKQMQKTIEANVRAQSTGAYESAISAELASYGYEGLDQLYDYCLENVKEKELNETYIKAHFDSLKASLEEKNPRLVSQIVVSIANPEALTEEEQTKLDNIDKALESGTFADAATAFSDDTNTADKKGFAGYIDADTANAGNDVVLADTAAAAMELEEGGVSEWLDVTDQSTGASYKVKVTVDTTDLDTILKNEDDSVQTALISAVLNANQGLAVHIVQDAAKGLKVSFGNEEAEKRLNEYMDLQKGEAEYE